MSDPPATNPSSVTPPTRQRIVFALIWVVVYVTAGAAICIWAVDRKGEVGSIVVWPLGWFAGLAARRILGGTSKLVGILLAVACFVMLLAAEVNWVHRHWRLPTGPNDTTIGTESWLEAASVFPRFIERYTMTAVLGAVCCALGAASAYRQAAVRSSTENTNGCRIENQR